MSEALAEVDGELTVNVKTINSEVYQFTLNNNTTVNEFKSLIRQRTDISEDRQRLIYRGKVLTDGTTIGEYHIESGHTVQFVARPENYRELQQSAASSQSNGTAPAPAVNIVQQTALDQMMRDIFGGETAGAVTEATRQGGLFGPSAGTPVALPAMDDGSMEHIRQGFLTLRTILATIGDPSITSEVNGHIHSGPHPRYYLGQWLDVKDTVNQWLEATVMNVDYQSNAIFVHYNGWPSRWDEWIPFNSPRIAPFRSRTAHSTALTSYVSPTPNVRIAGAPSTGSDDIRTLLPEIRNMMRRLQPIIEEAADIAEQSYLEEHPTATPGLLIGNPEAERSITASSVMFSRPRGNSAPTSVALSGRSGDIWSESEVRQAPIASNSSSSSSGSTNGIRSGAAPAPRLTQRFPLSFSPTRQVHVNTSTDNNNNSSSSGRSNGGDASTAAAVAAGHDDISGGGAGVGLFNITSSTTTLPPDLMSILTPLLGAASTEPSPVNTTTSGVGVAPVGSTFMVGSDGSVRVRQPTASSTTGTPSAASVSAVSGTTANLVSPASGESSSGSFDGTTTSANTATAAEEYSDFLSTLLRSFAAASAVTGDPAMSAAATALRGDSYGDDSDGDEYADNEEDEESEDQSDRDEVPDLEEVQPDGTTQIVHRRSERSERSDSSSSSRDANTRNTMNAADAAAGSVSESREARLRTLCGELCPLLDRFGRVLSDTSPFLRTYSQAPSSSGSSASGTASTAPASAVPSATAPPVPMSLEETLLQLMGVSRPPSPEPIRAYRSPIRTLPHAPGSSTGGSGGAAASGSTARAGGSSGSGVVGAGGAVATGPRFLSVNPAVAGVSGNPRVEMHIAVVNRNGQVLSNTPVNNPTALSAVAAAAFSAGRPAAAPTPLTATAAAAAAAAVASEQIVSQPSEASASAAAPGVDLSSVQSLHNRATSLLQQVQDISARSQQLNERTTAVTEYSNALHSIIRNINTVEEIRTSQRRINEINQQIETIRNRALAISATAAGIRERTAQVNAAADAITAATTTATASAFEGVAEATEGPDEVSAITANANAAGSRNDVDDVDGSDDDAASDPPLALPDELDEEDGDSEYSADNVGEWEEEELYEEELELLESMQVPIAAVAQSVDNEDEEGEEEEEDEEEVLLDDLVPTARIDTLLGEGRGGAASAYASSAASIASSATGDVTERMNPSITERLQYYSTTTTTTTAAATTTAGQVEDSEHPDSASHSLDDAEAAVVDDDNNDDDNSSSFSSCSEGRKNGDVSVDSDF